MCFSRDNTALLGIPLGDRRQDAVVLSFEHFSACCRDIAIRRAPATIAAVREQHPAAARAQCCNGRPPALRRSKTSRRQGQFLHLQHADAPSLLASARAALDRLKAAHPQLAPLLTKRGAKLLDENAVDFERATLDAEQRRKHDARVNAFIRTLAPCCASAPASPG